MPEGSKGLMKWLIRVFPGGAFTHFDILSHHDIFPGLKQAENLYCNGGPYSAEI